MRRDLHNITDRVFKGSRGNLYCFFSRMLERRFNVFDGHIGSMDESECSRMLNMFHFLEARAEHLRSLRETSEAGWLLEEYFLSHATCQEMRVYYILTVNDFSMAALKKSCVLGNNLRTILISLIKKGLPLFGDLAEYAQSEERLVLNALRERDSLTRELMSIKNLQHIEEEKNSSSSKTQEKRLTPYFYLWVQLLFAEKRQKFHIG